MFTQRELKLVEYRIMDTWKEYQDGKARRVHENGLNRILEEHDEWVDIKRKMEACS